MDQDSTPFLPRGVRLKQDTVRGVPVLLGPERVLMIDEVGQAILALVDGKSKISDICTALSSKFAIDRDTISADVSEYFDDLWQKRLLEVR